MFTGQHAKNLDDKDRIVVPAEFRKALAARGTGEPDSTRAVEFFITIMPKQGECLSLFPVDEFEKLFLGFAPETSFTDEDVQAYTRLVVGRSHRVSCDKQGRIHVPAHLKKDAGLKKEVVFVGVVNRAEVWDRRTWEDYNDAKRGAMPMVAQKIHRDRGGADRGAGRRGGDGE